MFNIISHGKGRNSTRETACLAPPRQRLSRDGRKEGVLEKSWRAWSPFCVSDQNVNCAFTLENRSAQNRQICDLILLQMNIHSSIKKVGTIPPLFTCWGYCSMRMLERFQQEQQQSTVSRYRAAALENVPDQQHGTAHSLTDVPRLQQALEAEGGWWSPKRTQQGAGAVQRAPMKRWPVQWPMNPHKKELKELYTWVSTCEFYLIKLCKTQWKSQNTCIW